MQTRENERRDSGIIIIVILLLGFICIILASGWALRFSPSWRLNTNMGSNLDPNSDFLTSRPISFLEPLDPAILTNPIWQNVFLTPGASFATRTPMPTATSTAVNIPPTNTPIPTLIAPATNTPIFVASPTHTKTNVPPQPVTVTPSPTNTPVTPPPSADLQITKTDGVTTYIPGATLTYTVTVRNNGANAAAGALVTDNKPAQITTWTWVCTSQTGGATGCNGVTNSNVNFADTVNLPNGASIVYTVTANISAVATGNLVNTASVAVPTGYTDPTPGNNSAIDTDTIVLPADVQITKTDGAATYSPGNTLTYTITFTNNGPNAVTGAVITDNIPAQIAAWTWACTAQNGGATGCDAVTGSSVDFTDTVNLPNGASIIYTVTANTFSSAVGSLINTADVTVPAGYTDLTSGNNSSTDTDTIAPAADLQITKNDGVTTYAPNGTLIYTVTVTNTGPSNVTGALVTDNKPAQITSWSWACTAQNGGATGCDAVTGSSADFTDTVNLPNGASIVYTVTAQVSGTATGSLVNTAVVSAPVGVTDANAANNSAVDTDILGFEDLSITKTDGTADYTAGAIVSYTITVTNTGTINLTGITLSDPLPAQITEWLWSCNKGIPVCASTLSTGNYTATFDLPVGDGIVFTVVANISGAASGNLVNTASVSTPSGLNRSATDTDIVDTIEPEIGPPDGGYISISTSWNLDLGPGNGFVFNGSSEPAYDLVYYERWFLNTATNTAETLLDCVAIEVSRDAATWYTVLYWCDGIPDTNTNIDINVIGGAETDNRAFPPPPLYANPLRPDLPTGVTIDVDAPLVTLGAPNGAYRYLRFSQVPEGGADGPQIDAIEILP